jgi:hypothetical protein
MTKGKRVDENGAVLKRKADEERQRKNKGKLDYDQMRKLVGE